MAEGRLEPDEIDEQTLAAHLYTAGMPDPDLLIRTAGEMRVSNFLLWQISYAEIWVTDACWPEFDEAAPAPGHPRLRRPRPPLRRTVRTDGAPRGPGSVIYPRLAPIPFNWSHVSSMS